MSVEQVPDVEFRMWDLRRDVAWLSENLDTVITEIDADELLAVSADLRRVARRAEAMKPVRAICQII